VVGKLHLSAAMDSVRTLVADAWKRGKRDLVGLSIDASGKAESVMREGVKVIEAQRITKVSSVDLIVEPGAGGQLIRMVESFNEDEDTMLRKKMLDTIKAKAPKAYAKLDAEKITDDALEVAYREAIEHPEEVEQPAPAAAPPRPLPRNRSPTSRSRLASAWSRPAPTRAPRSPPPRCRRPPRSACRPSSRRAIASSRPTWTPASRASANTSPSSASRVPSRWTWARAT
jgi:hypothetical protein